MIDAHCHINSLPDNLKERTLQKRDSFAPLEKTHPVKKEISNGAKRQSSLTEFTFIDVSIDSITSTKSLELSRRYNSIYSSLGFHPYAEEEFSEETITRYRGFFNDNPKAIAVGEIGLDYKAKRTFAEQESIFRRFIELSLELGLPIMLHNRMQNNAVFGILDDYLSDYRYVIFHCFSEDIHFLERVLNKNGNASFSLNVLRKKKSIDEALKEIPLSNLLLETDSPYMRIHGEYSSPLDVEKVYNYAMALKNISFDELSKAVYANARRVFGATLNTDDRGRMHS